MNGPQLAMNRVSAGQSSVLQSMPALPDRRPRNGFEPEQYSTDAASVVDQAMPELDVDPILEAARLRIEKRRSAERPMWHTLPARLMILAPFLVLPMLVAITMYLAESDTAGSGSAVLSGVSLTNARLTVVWQMTAGAVGAGYLGALWWSFAAAHNARRVTPSAPSTALPTIVFVICPIAATGLAARYPAATEALFVACLAIFTVGYLATTLSFRAATKKIGSDQHPWTVVCTFPVGIFGLFIFQHLVITTFTPPEVVSRLLTVVVGLGAIGYSLFWVISIWRATGTFDRACRRKRGGVASQKEEQLLQNLYQLQAQM